MMELHLQLGLALPSLSSFSPIKGLKLDPPLLFQRDSGCCDGDDHGRSRKRSFTDAFEDLKDVPRTLPLLLWDKQPNDDEDNDDPKDIGNGFNGFDGDEEEEGIVGWPPIKLRPKKFYQMNQSKKNRTVENGCVDCQGRSLSSSKYVKVKMEGEAIGRKINLSLYSSLTMIKQALFRMFQIRHENWSSYELTFQDREGGWLIAEDVPWRSFISSVQRLKLVKSSSS